MTEPTEPSEAGEPTAEAETSEAEAVEGDAPAETDAEPQETDFEGPRRRARREREERRAAQARATAIEEARREAKRRATGIVTTKKVGRGTVRGLKVLMWSALISVIVVGLGLLLYFTPVMSARNIVVVGLGAVTQEEVTNAAAVAPGTPLLQVDTDTVAERIAGIRRVATVRVQREYPSTLRVTIVEREPVVVKDYPDGPHLFDRDGVDFAIGVPPPGVPYLDTKNPGPHDAPTKAALEVMTSLRPEVAAQVARVDAPSVAAITLQLTDGRQVIWGTTDRTEEKALKLGALLTQPGKTYDVSSPDLPTVK
ncbi:cell division protein FtsQ/DivIB [Mycolicibacterium gadium]|uniref:Cell division protein FtsQ/DivIB n=1 Tax=Mycolicibacterium gadium TaxID=1794 RepID=A0ABT6GL19_MYCGU|nr:cell division protein FtsQ/DivIB [Mycolicibacterium gadium]MDG5482110.1 cell division protein FtsQ/DivIB [Mycolicibacterium gadium]